MKAAPEDRLATDSVQGAFPTKRVVLALAVVAVVVAVFWPSRVEDESPEPAPEPVVAEEVITEAVALPPAPDIPQRPAPAPAPVARIPEPAPTALPSLAESDTLAREQLLAAGAGTTLSRLQSSDHLVQTGAALIDGFSRGLVIRKILPVAPPAEPFSVQQEGDLSVMDPAGYRRYDDYARAITDLDNAAVVDSFHLLRPLYEQAYAQLGLSPDDFDNAVIRILDQVLATPEIEQPIELKRKSVMWLYADPALEQLSPLQKQLLRMGPDNIRRIKDQARALRAGLLSAPQATLP